MSAHTPWLAETNGSETAFPRHGEGGLTKREYIAALALQGWLAGCQNAFFEFTGKAKHTDIAAECSVKFADALLKELAK